MKFTLSEICKFAGIKQSRAEMWLSRGKLSVSGETTPGVTREWTIRDAYRLAIYAAIAKIRDDVAVTDGILDYAADNFKPKSSAQFFILYQDSGMWSCEVYTLKQLAKFFEDGRATDGVIVVDLVRALKPLRAGMIEQL